MSFSKLTCFQYFCQSKLLLQFNITDGQVYCYGHRVNSYDMMLLLWPCKLVLFSQFVVITRKNVSCVVNWDDTGV